ncbi:UV-endonuclease UVE-1 [Microsporum canis CBS 113480]|uniref:UV-endonuclease UVE-1 n=1 Tax=Arthroderma otae (strain ATCC MYA-4605 / CBS 113480) TaxID=554155 RepID=C5FCP2_ARTOC|nr:UV-endonuclease UVE-1 [Microsporum canis CBS 113480]EEQ27576.1 UV-endonuclease UVE-1 [Microsporum canis CBS 113480]
MNTILRTNDSKSNDEVPADEQDVKEVISQSPPIMSAGTAKLKCQQEPSSCVSCSWTCRIASILENRYSLQDPSQAFYATKNRPDRNKPPDVAMGREFVQQLGLANTRDLVTLTRWNTRYKIHFMRISSEMFPFASHSEYGYMYKLSPLASEALAEVGCVAVERNHHLTVYPGQGGYRELYQGSGVPCGDAQSLEITSPNGSRCSNDLTHGWHVWGQEDRPYSELNIPIMSDSHHYNILFNPDKVREGTLIIMFLYDRIRSTWTRKGTYIECIIPNPITKVQRWKHNPRVSTLPPCDSNSEEASKLDSGEINMVQGRTRQEKVESTLEEDGDLAFPDDISQVVQRQYDKDQQQLTNKVKFGNLRVLNKLPAERRRVRRMLERQVVFFTWYIYPYLSKLYAGSPTSFFIQGGVLWAVKSALDSYVYPPHTP